MIYKIGEIVSYKLDDLGNGLRGSGLIINNLNSNYSVFDEGQKIIARELLDINLRLLRLSNEENKRKAEKILNAYSKILESEKGPIVLL